MGVETGTVNGELVEIVKGVAAGEKLVVRGGFNLRDGDRVAVAAKP
jgi:multidrug efflux pump subunit AcrA (membrane-fusion protein)